MKTLILVMALAISKLCYAEINVYQSTDNTGINKKEQIDTIEKYLADLGTQLKKMEAKIDENAVKLKSLESSVANIRTVEIKKMIEDADEKKEKEKKDKPAGKGEPDEELEKLKADILAIKNTDIEQLRLDINGLRFSVKNVEKILKVPGK